MSQNEWIKLYYELRATTVLYVYNGNIHPSRIFLWHFLSRKLLQHCHICPFIRTKLVHFDNEHFQIATWVMAWNGINKLKKERNHIRYLFLFLSKNNVQFHVFTVVVVVSRKRKRHKHPLQTYFYIPCHAKPKIKF